MTPPLVPKVVVFFCHATQFEASYSLLKSSGHLEGRNCVGVHWDLSDGPRNTAFEELTRRFPGVEFAWVPSAVVESSTHPACAPIARGQIRHLAKRFGPVESWVFGFEFGWEAYLAKAVKSETVDRVVLVPEGLSIFTLRTTSPWRSITGKSALGLLMSGFLPEYLNRRKTLAHGLHWLKVIGSLLLRLPKEEPPREEPQWDLILHQFRGLETRLPRARISKFVPPNPIPAQAKMKKVLFLHDPKLVGSIDLARLATFMKAEFPQGTDLKSHPNPDGFDVFVESLYGHGYRDVRCLDGLSRAEELVGSGSYGVVIGWTTTTLVYCALNFPLIRTISINGFEKSTPGDFIGLSLVRAAGAQIEAPGLQEWRVNANSRGN